MQIRFVHLPIGQPFVFEGQAYVKSSPLMGRSEATGGERFISRSAMVDTGAPPPAPAPSRELAADEVLQAWRTFQAQLASLLEEVDRQGSVDAASERRARLAAAKAEFERKLGFEGSA